MVFGVFSPGRTHCIAPKKLPDKAMSIWNLHKKFQLSSAMGLRDFDLQSQPTLMGGEPINCRPVHYTDNIVLMKKNISLYSQRHELMSLNHL